MGVFVGIISGFIGATAFNKYYNFRKLPEALSFFNGKTFRRIRSYSSFSYCSYRSCYRMASYSTQNQWFWYVDCQLKETAPILAPFLFGTLERLLLPFGLHHMLTIPINYTQLGGTYEVLTGAAKGTKVLGQDPLWLA